MKIGWYKKVECLLTEYDLPDNFDTIKNHATGEWSCMVKHAIEKKNRERIEEECFKIEDGIKTPKTKTATIIDKIRQDNYKRQPEKEFLSMTKRETKTIMTARYGMLQCGRNFKGTEKLTCQSCKVLDDENHRLNSCPKWSDINLANETEKANFHDVYSGDIHILRNIIPHIETLWNVKNAHGTMNTE